MNIATACDHGGFELKQIVQEYLSQLGHQYRDFGCYNTESCDYPDYIFPACEAVARGKFDRGIVVCTTGIGVSVCANKVDGVRAALCFNTEMAELTRLHNDTNVLALGAKVVDEDTAKQIISVWLNTPFSGADRHARRIGKITEYEKKR